MHGSTHLSCLCIHNIRIVACIFEKNETGLLSSKKNHIQIYNLHLMMWMPVMYSYVN